MMKYFRFTALFLGIIFSGLAAGVCFAADTTVELSIASGQSDSVAYGLTLRQAYEPLVSTSAFDLRPTAAVGAHVWDRSNDTVVGASIAPGLMLNLYTSADIQPYIAGSVGGIAVSDDEFGPRDFGSNFMFQTRGAVGVHFGEGLRHRVQGEYTNYSTWGITSTNEGYNTYGVSYGYSF